MRENKPRGGRGDQMTEHHNSNQDNSRRCQAITSKGLRCRNRPEYYRFYEGDGLEYLCCRLHYQFFTPYPGQKGQKPPKEG